MKKWLFSNKWDILIWSVAIIFLFRALNPLLTGEIIAGWDTTSHYYLFTKMVEFLKQGRISGYDPDWFAGYPAFTFYGPFPYIVMSIPYFISGGLISMAWSFNLFLFILPFLFLVALYFTSRVWFGRKVAPFSLIFGILFLATIKLHAYVGFGLHGMIYVGLFSAIFAITLMVLFLGIIKLALDSRRKLWLILGALLLAMIIMTHAMTTIFTGIAFAIFTLLNFRKFWKKALLIFIGGLLLSSFWLIPFLLNLAFSSGDEIGMGGMLVNDPLLALFPLVQKMNFSAWPGILILISTVAGVIALIARRIFFWPAAFLMTLIFLPRDYFHTITDLPLHYYRFTTHVAVLGIIICSFGLSFIMGKIQKLKYEIGVIKLREIVRGIIAAFVVAALMIGMLNHLNLTNSPENYRHKYSFPDYPDNISARKMVEYIGGLPVKGRIAAYSNPILEDMVGSPHYFTTFLSLEYNLPVMPGLLAESALSTQYLIPVLNKLGISYNWGKTPLLYDSGFSGQNMETMIKRLELYGVEYILLNKPGANNLMQAVKGQGVELVKEIEDFSLLKIVDFKPLIESTNYKPFLFIDAGGMDFRQFSQEWFKSVELFDYPVIYTEKVWNQLSVEEKSGIDGFIVSFRNGSKMDEVELKSWMDIGKNLIFLGAEKDFKEEVVGRESASISKARFIEDFAVNEGLDKLKSALIGFNGVKIVKKEVMPEVKEDMRLVFGVDGGGGSGDGSDKGGSGVDDESGVSGDGVDDVGGIDGGFLINYSYFPKWVRGEGQTVFWATPNMMWVFGEGEIEYE